MILTIMKVLSKYCTQGPLFHMLFIVLLTIIYNVLWERDIQSIIQWSYIL